MILSISYSNLPTSLTIIHGRELNPCVVYLPTVSADTRSVVPRRFGCVTRHWLIPCVESVLQTMCGVKPFCEHTSKVFPPDRSGNRSQEDSDCVRWIASNRVAHTRVIGLTLATRLERCFHPRHAGRHISSHPAV